MSPIAHDSVWAPTAPVIEHADAGWDSVVPVAPASSGSGSLRVTAVAVPGPPFDTVTVKPTEVPHAFPARRSADLNATVTTGGGGKQFSVQGGVVTSMVAKS